MPSSPFNTPLTLTTPSHTLILSKATPADIPSLCTVYYDAYVDNPMLHAAYATAPRVVSIAADVERWKLDWPRPGRHAYKAVDAATGYYTTPPHSPNSRRNERPLRATSLPASGDRAGDAVGCAETGR
ncbi:hypothetical protein V502_01577 [Pseudogymnoascus sp. VKM F-4520 (FW-2644)]|nr:hypothetical protein V502_01577 [Pseudogymnoascus sp. VKM F-4520 (FW-2644)]